MSNAGLLLAQSGAPFIRCKTYTYVLQVKQLMPSRMVIVKNVLGNSVSMYSPWEPPNAVTVTNPEWTGWPYTQSGPVESVTLAGMDDDTGIETGTRHEAVFARTWSWAFTFTDAAGRAVGPGIPFVATNSDQRPTIGTLPVASGPADVVGSTTKPINWGMTVYSTNLGGVPGRQNQIIQVPDTADSGDVSAIQSLMRLAKDGGTDSFGSTPTKGALEFANTVMRTVAEGGFLTDGISYSETLERDGQLICNRLYGHILVTDGISNRGNPGGSCQPWGNWAEGCLKCTACCIFELDEDGNCCTELDGDGQCVPGSIIPPATADGWYDEDPGCPDGGPSGYTCPDGYENFAAGPAQDGYGIAILSPGGNVFPLKLRTFVVGLSADVGPCELNHIAYRGRTDASAPDLGNNLGQAFFLPGGPDHTTGDDYDNPRLGTNKYCQPGNAGQPWYRGPCRADPCDTSNPDWAKPYHGHYAFFAETAEALANSIVQIVANAGVGDYTTSGPTVSSPGPGASYGLITSAEYPGWIGHVYSYDVENPNLCNTDADCTAPAECLPWDGSTALYWGVCGPPYTYNMMWDAGQVLSSGNAGSGRFIYTWNPQDSTGKPIRINSSVNISSLDTLCNGCGITAEVVDFIQGNDGTGTNTRRSWLLGPIMNSGGAVIGPPPEWTIGSGHREYQREYSTKRKLFWVGSSDGMIHAFDLATGVEVLALLPPDLLAMQVQLYQNYRGDPVARPVGQKEDAKDFIYGVATSPRYSDVYDARDPTDKRFRTVLYFGLGPGGRSLHAVDVTHPWALDANGNGTIDGTQPTGEPRDPNWGFGDSDHVKILWSLTGKEAVGGETQIIPLLSGLGETWSIPALGMSNDAAKSYHLVVGGGYIPYAEGTDTQSGRYFMIEPLTGVLQSAGFTNPVELTPMGGAPFVRNQGFAPSTIWDTRSNKFRPDNPVDEALQPDLHGQLWLVKRGVGGWSTSTLPDATSVMLGSPIYFNTPVAGYPITTPTHNLMVAVSGSFYEESPNVTGGDIGEADTFTPKIFLIARTIADQSVSIHGFPIAGLPVDGGLKVLGRYTQATAYPMLLVPDDEVSPAMGVFLLYDRTLYGDDCVGRAYLLRVHFKPDDLTAFAVDVTDAGLGAASGVVLGKRNPLVAHSWAGAGVPAYFFTDWDTYIDLETDALATVQWWRELM